MLPGCSTDGIPSQPLALTALLRAAGSDGAVAFGALAVVYREDHLALHQADLGKGPGQGGALSMDEVRRHLQSSVLPRLVTTGSWSRSPRPSTKNRPFGCGRSCGEGWWPTAPRRRARSRALAEAAVPGAEPPPSAGVSGSTLTGRALTKIYRGRRVVDEVDISLRQGEIVGLLGPNGAGKTTTFYMIVGLVRPDTGHIFIDEEGISSLPMYQRARRGIGYLSQEPSIFVSCRSSRT